MGNRALMMNLKLREGCWYYYANVSIFPNGIDRNNVSPLTLQIDVTIIPETNFYIFIMYLSIDIQLCPYGVFYLLFSDLENTCKKVFNDIR